jgi:hypothetical protein
MVAAALEDPAAAAQQIQAAATEFFTAVSGIPGIDRIDRANRLIRDVKVAGLYSVNSARVLGLPPEWGDALDEPYGYDPQALRNALNLYSNARVYLDHPETRIDETGRRVISASDRKVEDHFGRLINVRFVDGDGIRADLEYLECHPLASKILETAERMSEQLALSHRAFLDPVLSGGRVVIRSIRRVLSVDLITENPGTTVTLFESAANMDPNAPTTPAAQEADILGGAPPAAPAPGAPAAPTAPAQEDGDMEGGGSPSDLVMKGLQAAVMAVVTGEGSAADKMAKIQTLLEQMDAVASVLTDAGSAAPAAPAGEAPAASPAAAESAVNRVRGLQLVESAIQKELNQLRSEKEARLALESAGVQANATRIAAVAALPAAARAALVQEFKAGDARQTIESDSIFRFRGAPALESGAGDVFAPMDEVDSEKFVQSLRR